MFTIGTFYIINDVLKQLYCGCGCGPTTATNNKCMFTNLLKNYIILYICYMLYYVLHYLYYISDPRHTEISNLTDARWAQCTQNTL